MLYVVEVSIADDAVEGLRQGAYILFGSFPICRRRSALGNHCGVCYHGCGAIAEMICQSAGPQLGIVGVCRAVAGPGGAATICSRSRRVSLPCVCGASNGALGKNLK